MEHAVQKESLKQHLMFICLVLETFIIILHSNEINLSEKNDDAISIWAYRQIIQILRYTLGAWSFKDVGRRSLTKMQSGCIMWDVGSLGCFLSSTQIRDYRPRYLGLKRLISILFFLTLFFIDLDFQKANNNSNSLPYTEYLHNESRKPHTACI